MPTFFELTLDDTSPVIKYYPLAETLPPANVLDGWDSYFSQSGFLSQPGERGLGDSLHVTSLDGAALTIQWFGTGISLIGNVVNATYQVSVDGGVASIGIPHQDVLVEVQNLQPKQHMLALIAHPNAAAFNTLSHLAFDRAILNISADVTGASISSEAIDVTSARWIFSGAWAAYFEQDPLFQSNQPYRHSNTRNSAASITFTGSAVGITGIRNATHGRYNVTLDGMTTMFDGHSYWMETSTLFLQAGLDETVQHTLSITNADDATLAINGINITHVSGGTPDQDVSGSDMTTGTLIGVVFAVLISILAVVTVAACMYFRQRRRSRKPNLKFTSGGISSAQFFRDLDTEWSSVHHRRPSLSSNTTEYTLRGPYTTAPHTVYGQGGPNSHRSRDRAGSFVELVVDRKEERNDPTSPLPYPRLSKTSSAANAPIRPGREKSKSERLGENIVNGPVRDLLASHMHRDDRIVDSGELSPAIMRPLDFHSRKRGTAADARSSPQPLRVGIPLTNPIPISLSGTRTSQGSRRSPIFQRTPSRGASTRHTSEASQDTPPPSVSTMQFATPWDSERRGSGSTGASTAVVLADEGTPF